MVVLAPQHGVTYAHSGMTESLTADEKAWIAADERLRRRAEVLAARFGRDPEDMYKTLKNLARAPVERLRLGLMHGRLRSIGSRTQATE